MPTLDPFHQTLMTPYNQLPWYKKVSLWLSAPRLAWGLFGYKQTPNKNQIKQLIKLAKASWFFKTKLEEDLCHISNYNEPPPKSGPCSGEKLVHNL